MDRKNTTLDRSEKTVYDLKKEKNKLTYQEMVDNIKKFNKRLSDSNPSKNLLIESWTERNSYGQLIRYKQVNGQKLAMCVVPEQIEMF